MNKYSKYNRLVAKFLVFVLTVTTVFFGIPPGTARAASPQELLNYVPESKPGGLTITWYDAKRYNMTDKMGTYSKMFKADEGLKDDSWYAFAGQDRSTVIKTESISDLIFDLNDWVEDEESQAAGTRDNLVWGEVAGYIQAFRGRNFYICPAFNTAANYELEIDGIVVSSNWTSNPPPVTPWYQMDSCLVDLPNSNNEDVFYSFRLRIGHYSNAVYPSSVFRVLFGNVSSSCFMTYNRDHVFSTLALKDMKKFFKIDYTNYTLNLDPEMHKTFPADQYVYGICTGDPALVPTENLKTLKLGSNVLDRIGGKVFVRNKIHPKDYIVIDTLSTLTVNDLAVKERTPYTAALTWSAPLCGMPVTGYDIYRRVIGVTENPASFPKDLAVSGQSEKVGSTTQLSFTDQGLEQDEIYEYYIVTNYETVPEQKSNIAKTDSVTMTGVPGMPTDLRVEGIKLDTLENGVTLRWNEAPPVTDLKYYVVYRTLTKAQTPEQNAGTGSNIMILEPVTGVFPEVIGRTTVPSFIDASLDYGDTCDYYVQAVFKDGPPSFITAPLNVVVKDATAPTAPGDLKIGNVLRQGEDVRYDFPDNPGIGNALLGPRCEVVLQWDPSEDNTGVTGYDVYRKGFGKDLKDYTYWEEEEHLVGSTTDNVFVDSGLKYGANYIYSVEAKDKEGNKTRSEAVSINTMKPTLSDLSIKNGSKYLTPSPAFVYYNTDYTLDVANETSAIRLIPRKTDSLSEVVINGIGVDGGIDLALDPGENVIPIEVRQSSVTQETMNYTLTVNRANLEDLPALNLTDPGAAIKEGGTFKTAGNLELQAGRDWKGTVDYGDGTGFQPLRTNKDGSFVLEHQYLDNGQFKVNVKFRYLDKGMVERSITANVENVAPVLTGIKDEYTIWEGDMLKIDGTVVDPGQDNWIVTGYADGLGPQISTEVMADKTFSLGETVFDKRPEYDMRLQVTDGDGGIWSKNVKVKVQNVAPVVQAKGVPMVQRGVDFIGSGSFADPGQDSWQATVDYGDGSGIQPLKLKADKTFDLKHVFARSGNYTVTVHVEDQDQGAGNASLQVKVKDHVSTLELGEDISLNEGDTLSRSILVWGFSDRISKIIADYGDGSGEKPVALTANKSGANFLIEEKSALPIGTLSLQHTYKDNGTYTVKAKIIDTDGDIYEDSFKAEVANVVPAVQLLDGVIYAGDSFTCRGTITDPGDDTWTAVINSDYGFQPLKIEPGKDKTFSFDRIYNKPGIYHINAEVKDDDGGVGYASSQLTVNRHPSASASVSDDATLHSLSVGAPLTQHDGSYSDADFIPECLHYTVPGSAGSLHVIANADSGAALQYYDYGTSTWAAFSQSPAAFDFAIDSAHELKIRVFAADGVTTREYIVSY